MHNILHLSIDLAMKALHFSIFICLVIFVSACSTTPKPSSPVVTKVNQVKTLQPEEVISKALNANSPEQRTVFFFQAAKLYWERNLYAQSDAALGSVHVELLNEGDAQQYFKMALYLATQSENIKRINSILPRLPPDGFPRLNVAEQIELTLLLSKAYEIQGANIQAAITLIEHRGLLEPENLKELDEKVWHLLRSSQTAELSQYIYTGSNLDALAWLDLARTIQLNQISLETGCPVIYGMITADTIEQAIERSGTKAGNKGGDAAMAAIEMANLLRQLPGGQ